MLASDDLLAEVLDVGTRPGKMERESFLRFVNDNLDESRVVIA